MLRSLTSLVAIAIFACFALGNQFAAMLMYWWFSLFRPHEWMWWDVTSYRLPLVAAALFFGWSVVAGKLPRFDHPVAAMIGLYTALTIITQVVTGCTTPHPIRFDHVLILVFVTLASERQLVSVRHIFILAVFATLSFGLQSSKAGWNSLLNGGSLYIGDITGGGIMGSNAVALSSSMCLFLLFSAYRCLGKLPAATPDGEPATVFPPRISRALRWSLPIIMLGLAGVVVTSDSRGSSLSSGVGLILITFLSPNRMRNILVMLVLLVAVYVAAPNPDSFFERISTAFAEEEDLDKSAASRPHFWNVALKMANHHPIGVGVGCYVKHYRVYDPSNGFFGNNRSVHSSHFGIAAELGYPGLLLWILINLAAIKALWRARVRSRGHMEQNADAHIVHHFSTGMMVALIVFLIGGTFYELSYNDFTWLIFAMAIACDRQAARWAVPASYVRPLSPDIKPVLNPDPMPVNVNQMRK